MRAHTTKDGKRCVADAKAGAKWELIPDKGTVTPMFGAQAQWTSTTCTPGCHA